MYIKLRDITKRQVRMGEYPSYSTAYDSMIQSCIDDWSVSKEDLFIKFDFENSDNREDVYRVYHKTRSRRFSIEIKN